MIIKSLSVSHWTVYHKELGPTKFLKLNTDVGEQSNDAAIFQSTDPTDTEFTVQLGSGSVNSDGQDYVAYLFADNPDGRY